VLISNIIGGLGNQMFQYALGRAVSLRTNSEFKIDIQDFDGYFRKFELGVFNVQIKLATRDEVNKVKYRDPSFVEGIWREIRKKGRPKGLFFIKEKSFNFDCRVLDIHNSAYFFGYWQSQRYFLEIREILLDEFTPKKTLSKESELFVKKIGAEEAISVHIRRGDYVSNPSANEFHGTCDLDYYKKAVLEMEKDVPSGHFFVFSDDLSWARENLTFIKNKTFVDLGSALPDYEEMILMSQCQHNIIANSSFSWWGAWLNENPKKKVIAPKKWFVDSSIDMQDLIPAEWLRF